MVSSWCPHDTTQYLCVKDPSTYCPENGYERDGKCTINGNNCSGSDYVTQDKNDVCEYTDKNGKITTFDGYYKCNKTCKGQMCENGWIAVDPNLLWYKSKNATEAEAVMFKHFIFDDDSLFKNATINQEYTKIMGPKALYFNESSTKYSACEKAEVPVITVGDTVSKTSLDDSVALNRDFSYVEIRAQYPMDSNSKYTVKQDYSINKTVYWDNIQFMLRNNDGSYPSEFHAAVGNSGGLGGATAFVMPSGNTKTTVLLRTNGWLKFSGENKIHGVVKKNGNPANGSKDTFGARSGDGYAYTFPEIAVASLAFQTEKDEENNGITFDGGETEFVYVPIWIKGGMLLARDGAKVKMTETGFIAFSGKTYVVAVTGNSTLSVQDFSLDADGVSGKSVMFIEKGSRLEVTGGMPSIYDAYVCVYGAFKSKAPFLRYQNGSRTCMLEGGTITTAWNGGSGMNIMPDYRGKGAINTTMDRGTLHGKFSTFNNPVIKDWTSNYGKWFPFGVSGVGSSTGTACTALTAAKNCLNKCDGIKNSFLAYEAILEWLKNLNAQEGEDEEGEGDEDSDEEGSGEIIWE